MDRMKSDHELPRQNNYETAAALARSRLAALDFARQCERAGLDPRGGLAELPFIDRRYLIAREGLIITAADSGPPPEKWEEIIALHYLAHATGAPPADQLITYRQVPDGAPYWEPFNRRTGGILLSAFAGRLRALVPAAISLGGREVEGHGDFAVAVRALPRVEYLFAGWEGDEEFPPEVKVLFDDSIIDYLPAEDITVLCQMVCLKLARAGADEKGRA